MTGARPGRRAPSLVAATFVLAPLALAACGDARAPTPPPVAPAPPDAVADTTAPPLTDDLAVFWADLQAAIATGDPEALLPLTAFAPATSALTAESFRDEVYPVYFAQGAFRARLLADGPEALERQPDGSARYLATVELDTEGMPTEDGEAESSMILVLAPTADAPWRLVDVQFAG